ncbi:MAG: glycosyltransferase family 39 protein [Anaerolineales bacterium]|nr:glycosyltransferase family 39 protein [Anaerolineales bacterium]
MAINSKSLRLALYWLAFTGILILAIASRVVYLGEVGFNSDEAVYAGQGAAIAQAPVLKDIFPVFRAHPLLFQFILALLFQFGVNELSARLVSAAIGVATVLLVYRLGVKLYGTKAGLIAALIMALMPYHVVVTRQVLLDGPMAFFATLTLYMLVRFAETSRPAWLIATGAGLGLTFLAKETGIILLSSVYAFLALSPEVRTRVKDIIFSLATMVLVMVPFPLSVMLAGGGGDRRTEQYLVWQLFRRPNHTWDFYPGVVTPAIGILVILSAIAGLWLLRKSNTWRERALVSWIIVPVVFFQLWPTKGFQYLLPIAPALALLAARTLAHWPEGSFRIKRWVIPRYAPGMLLAGAIVVTSLSSSLAIISPAQSISFLAGSGGVPGGRETGIWLKSHVPTGATFMTIGPSMANIIKFYGHRDAYGLSVSPNPLHRNPSYEPVHNPDYQIRIGEIQYLVWDSFSTGRSSFFSEKLLYYVEKYNGRAIYTETVTITTPEGNEVEKPVIIIYEVHP